MAVNPKSYILVMKKPSFRLLVSSFLGACLTFAASAQTTKMLSPLTSFGIRGDGSIQPLDQVWIDTLSNQRGIACDPVSGNVIFVDTHSGSGGSAAVQGSIFVLDGATAAVLGTLNTNGINGGSYADAPVGVADDGVVYVANQITSSTGSPLKIYRWNSANDTNSPPVVAFNSTVTPTQRYGVTMDVRGSGNTTQIILGGSSQSGGSGTNVLILTTTDGTNFTATVLATDVTTPNFIEGIAFGAGNTFWAKSLNAPLRLMSFDLGTATAVTLKSWTSANLIGSANLGPIAVDVSNNLLAAMEEAGGVVGGGVDHIWLYDIADTNKGPVLLDVKDFPALTPQPNNATAPPAYLSFGANRLYAHIVNNGVMAYSVDTVSTPGPVIVQQPAATNRLASGSSITLSIVAYPAVTYQWRSNNVPISGATNASYALTSVTASYSGTYSCIVSNGGGTVEVTSVVSVVNPADLYHLNLLWRVGANDGQPWMNSTGGANTPNQRTLGYNALSNHLYIVSRSSATTSNYVVHVLNATNGAFLYTLNTNGIQLGVGKGGIGLTCIDVASDGAVYACNESPDAAGTAGADPSGFFRIYRWADANSNTVPTLIFAGDPASQSGALRWGDTMRVRGSGINTRIIVDCNSREAGNTKKKVAVGAPTDQYCTNFTFLWMQADNVPATGVQNPTPIGKSLEFDGNNNAWWMKNKSGYLVKSSYDPSTPGVFGFPNIDYSVVTIISNNFPGALYGVGLDLSRNLAAGVFTNGSASAADQLNLYDLTDPNAPLQLAQYSFPVSPRNTNPNFISQTFFANNMLFTLDGNNGIMVFKVASGPLEAPTFVTQPRSLRLMLGGTGTMAANTLETATFQWQHYSTNIPGATSNSFTISNAQLADGGPYRVIASNPFSGSATSVVANVSITLPADTYSLGPIWGAPIGSQTYLRFDNSGSTPFQRSLGYSAVSDKLLVINRTSSGGGLSVNVLDPATGAKLYELDDSNVSLPATTPHSTDNIILSMLGVADDGAVYAANVSMANNTTASAIFRLWRWADIAPTTPAVLVYEGEPANSTNSLRWGDTFHVRGSGVNTEVILDQPRGALSAACVLVPTDGSMTSFTNRPFLHNYSIAGVLGRSAQFGPTNTLWQKTYSGSLMLSRYDTNAGTSTVLTNFPVFPATMGGVFIDHTRNLAVGVDFVGTAQTSPDVLNFYEISDLSAPLLIAKFNFPTNQQGNANHFSHAVFTPNRIFVLDANNAIFALSLAPTLSEVVAGQNVVLSWPTNYAGFTLQASPSLTPPVTWTNVSTGTIVGGAYTVTNSSAVGSRFYRLKH